MPYNGKSKRGIAVRFRTRLIITYSLLVTGLITITAFVFEIYNLKHLETLSHQDLDVLCKNMSHQLDEIVRPMAFITEFFLSDSRALSAITTLTRAERDGRGNPFITKAKQDIRTALSTYCNNVNFHRVSFFSEYGDILSSNLQVHTIPDGSAVISSIPGISWVDAAMGKAVLLPSYDDPWDRRNPQRVFSIVRRIMGNNIASYIEVQKPEQVLEDIYNLNRTGTIRVAVINGRGEVFYSHFDDDTNAALLQLVINNSDLEERPLISLEGNISASYYSSYTDTYTIVSQGRETMDQAVQDITLVTILMALFICLASIIVIWVLSLRVSAPIAQLITRIEHTNLHNMDHDVTIEYTDDELVHLCDSYNQLLKRLNRARRQEEQMSLLHLQAEFDALQSQVNPHFIYNVLNVISHRGVINKDEVICGICEKLAAMLRYSAGTSKRLVTIGEELAYLEDYLYLLKTRYRNKLEYTITVNESVKEQRIPKIVLQQLIENSITHGFRDSPGIMSVSVLGGINDAYWFMEVRDNGQGFSESEIKNLMERMEEIKISVKEENLRFDIGGMGILNMYARFLISFGDDVIFRLSNDGGAVVTIGALLSRKTERPRFPLAEPVQEAKLDSQLDD
jgi:two-component system sensor histidine kinase YesM